MLQFPNYSNLALVLTSQQLKQAKQQQQTKTNQPPANQPTKQPTPSNCPNISEVLKGADMKPEQMMLLTQGVGGPRGAKESWKTWSNSGCWKNLKWNLEKNMSVIKYVDIDMIDIVE